MTLQRHPPKRAGRCCWLCGDPGGVGVSAILKNMGYDIQLSGPMAQIGYAHATCLSRRWQKERKP